MIYAFKTNICTWVICPNDLPSVPWDLRWYIDGDWEKSGAYTRPDIAADDVAHQATGFSEWDLLPFMKIPSEIADIGEWQKLRQYP